MSDHRTNPRAIAKQNGGQVMQLVDLGDGVGLAGFEIKPMFRPMACDCAKDAEGHTEECASKKTPLLIAGLFAVGGRVSPLLTGVELRGVMMGEIGGMPVADVKRLLSQVEAPPAEANPQ